MKQRYFQGFLSSIYVNNSRSSFHEQGRWSHFHPNQFYILFQKVVNGVEDNHSFTALAAGLT
jgi:hypothetical protein